MFNVGGSGPLTSSAKMQFKASAFAMFCVIHTQPVCSRVIILYVICESPSNNDNTVRYIGLHVILRSKALYLLKVAHAFVT